MGRYLSAGSDDDARKLGLSLGNTGGCQEAAECYMCWFQGAVATETAFTEASFRPPIDMPEG